MLQRTSGLSQQSIRVYLNPNDMRAAWAYLPNGADLGRLYVLDGWRYSRHTLRLRLRRRILRERRIGKLKFAGEQDPVQIFAESQRRSSKRGRKQGTLELRLTKAWAGAAAEGTRAPPARAARSAPSAGRTPESPIDLSDLTIRNR